MGRQYGPPSSEAGTAYARWAGMYTHTALAEAFAPLMTAGRDPEVLDCVYALAAALAAGNETYEFAARRMLRGAMSRAVRAVR